MSPTPSSRWFVTKWWGSEGIVSYDIEDPPTNGKIVTSRWCNHLKVGEEAFATLEEARAQVLRLSELDEKRHLRLAKDRRAARERLLKGEWPEVKHRDD